MKLHNRPGLLAKSDEQQKVPFLMTKTRKYIMIIIIKTKEENKMGVCSICHGGCCRRYYIDLTGYDMINISNTLELEIPIFTQLLAVKDEDAENLKKDAALFKFLDDEQKRYYRFCLKQTKSTIIPETLKCMFLQEWDGKSLGHEELNDVIGRCGIYGPRPYTCAIYPAKLDATGIFGYVPDPHKNCERKKTAAYNVCPRPIVDKDFGSDTEVTTKNLALHKFEMDFFKAFAKHWNQNPGYLSDFFTHLKEVYSKRLMYQDETFVSE